MSLTRLDNEFPAFLEAERRFLADPTARAILEVTPETGLRQFINALKLQNQLDRVAEQSLLPEQRQFLALAGLDEAFLDHLEKGKTPSVKVLSKGDDIRIRIDGLAADLPLWEVSVNIRVRDLYYTGVAVQQQLNPEALVYEGMRRLHVKGDLLRNSGVRFVEAGTRYRTEFEWHSYLLEVLMGDLGDLLLGTTNPAMALAYGLTLGGKNEARRVQEPSVRELEAILDAEHEPVVVYGVNAFQMAHLYGHVGDAVSFEWDRDLTCDMGPAGRFLPITAREIVPTAK